MRAKLRALSLLVTGVFLTIAALSANSSVSPPAYGSTPTPAISSLTPNTGLNSMSHEVVIAGSNLDGATSVRFGEINATDLSYDSGAGTLTVTVPQPTFDATPIGAVSVIVSSGEETDSNSATFTWTNPRFMLDNGLLRFGGGGENNSLYSLVDSVTTTGMPEQPFYKDGSLWRKLTYSTLALNYAIGTKAASGNTLWSGSKAVGDPTLSDRRVRFRDDDGVVLSPTSNSVVSSSGTLYVDGTVTVNSNELRIEHEYFLGSGNSYVSVTSRVTNLTSTAAENVHLWVGTRDDWVGYRPASPDPDSPRKIKGTLDLTAGEFSALENKEDPADALQILSGTGSVMFFATPVAPVTANMTVSGRSLSLLTETDPTTVTVDQTGDQAYALVAGLGNLEENQSREITWFYAAADPDDLGDVVSAVAEAAGGAGTLSSPTTDGGSLTYEVDYGGVTTDNETHFALVVDRGSVAPTAAQIEAGVDFGSVVARFTGSSSARDDGATFSIIGLSEASDYTYYVVTKYDDEDSSVSDQYSEITSGNFVSLPGTPTVSSVTAGDGEVSVAISPSSNETNFRYSTDSWATSTTRAPVATTSPWVITGLTNGTDYSFQFRSIYSGQEGAATSTFTVTPRPPAVYLSDLTASAGALAPAFDANTLSYSLSVPNATSTVNLTPTSAGNTIAVAGNATTSGQESSSIPLSVGSNNVQVTVVSSATGAVSTVYTITVTRAAPATAILGDGGGGPTLTPQPVVTPPAVAPRVIPRLPATPPSQQGPVLRGNVAPAPPSAPTATIGGRSTPIQTQMTSPTGFSLTAGVLNLGLQVQGDQGVVRQNGTGGTEVEVKTGSTTALTGSGLLPRSTVQVFLPLQGTNSKEVARIPVDETGAFSGDAVFATRANERPMQIGRQVMQIVSLDENGQQSVVEMTINIAQGSPAPEFDRAVGQVPTLTPGQSVATNAGEPEIVRVTADSAVKSATVDGDGWTMSVNIEGARGEVSESGEGGALLQFVRDEGIIVTGGGFMPGTRADVWLFSDPTLLGTVDIDGNGEFSGTVMVDGNVVPVGDHTLQLQGVGDDGYVRAANLGVTVSDAVVEVTTEEAAGGFLWWLWLLVILVALVAWFAISRYRGSRGA